MKLAMIALAMASWYHEPQMMANGKRFNPDAPTCAHKTYPFGTVLKVTNTRNGKTTTCTVTDRGPYIKGRVVDVSRYGAKELGMISSGVAPVQVQVVSAEKHLVIPCADCAGDHQSRPVVADKRPVPKHSKPSQRHGTYRPSGKRPRPVTSVRDVFLRNLRS